MEAVERKTGSPAARSLLAGAAGAVLALALRFLCAWGLAREWLPQGRALLFARAALVLSGGCAAYLACRKQSGGKAVYAAESASVPVVLLILLQFVTNSSPAFNLSLLANVLCVVCGALTGCLLTARRGTRRRKRRRRDPVRRVA